MRGSTSVLGKKWKQIGGICGKSELFGGMADWGVWWRKAFPINYAREGGVQLRKGHVEKPRGCTLCSRCINGNRGNKGI